MGNLNYLKKWSEDSDSKTFDVVQEHETSKAKQKMFKDVFSRGLQSIDSKVWSGVQNPNLPQVEYVDDAGNKFEDEDSLQKEFDIQAKRHNIEETNLRIMEDHEVNAEAPNELSTDEQKYACALTQVNAQAVAKVLEQLPTKGNEAEIYKIIKILAQIKTSEVIKTLPEQHQYKDARIVAPATWIKNVIEPRLDPALRPAVMDMGSYTGSKNFYTSLVMLRRRKGTDSSEIFSS